MLDVLKEYRKIKEQIEETDFTIWRVKRSIAASISLILNAGQISDEAIDIAVPYVLDPGKQVRIKIHGAYLQTCDEKLNYNDEFFEIKIIWKEDKQLKTEPVTTDGLKLSLEDWFRKKTLLPALEELNRIKCRLAEYQSFSSALLR